MCFHIYLLERNIKVVLSLERQNSLIFTVHSGLGRSIQSKVQSSHLCHDKCFSTLQERYSFSMMRDRIQMYIEYCEPCQMQNSYKLEKCPHVFHSIPVPAKCWTQICIDIIGSLRESNNKKYIVTCVDYFSKYIEAKSLENKTGSAVGAFLYELICRYGVMDIMITDQGTF